MVIGRLNVTVSVCARTVSATCPGSARAGTTATVSCKAESSNPATTLTVSKDGVQLSSPANSPNTPGDFGGRVTEVKFTTDVLTKNNHSDMYTCCATNPTLSTCAGNLCHMCTLNVECKFDSN